MSIAPHVMCMRFLCYRYVIGITFSYVEPSVVIRGLHP
jgi:hypothetical protein